MASTFPTSLDNFTNPTVSDYLNSTTVPHATQHADLNDAVEALEAKVGVDGSAVTSSHDYILTNGVLPTLNVDSGVLVVDDTNNRVGVNDATPSYALDVTGDINTTGDLRIGGTAVGDWTAYTPTWTALTVGNGTQAFYYSVVNGIMFIEGRLILGSTSSVSNNPKFSLPSGYQTANNGFFAVGHLNIRDTGTGEYIGQVKADGVGQTVLLLKVVGAASTYGTMNPITSSVPMTWAATDEILVNVTIGVTAV